MKHLVLVLFLGRRHGIRLWRTRRERSGRGVVSLGTLAEWEIELLAARKFGRFFSW